MKKAAVYSRFSTHKQRDASIEDQERECERTARAAGLTVVVRFHDKEISAGTAMRPGYQALLAGARRGEFDVIVTEDVSRLWRNRAEFGPRSAELEDLGVHCLTCVGDDTRRDGWGLVMQIKQAVAEHARREASYRTRRGQEGRARAGKSAGGRAYGYIPAALSKSGEVEIEHPQAEVVRRVYTMYAEGMSPRNIAARLNAEGVPSPGAAWKRTKRRRDAKWLASAIHGDPKRGSGILNNRRYIGVVSWGRTEWSRSAADSSVRRVKVLDRARVEHADERLRIVSDRLWEQVKARQARTARAQSPMTVRGTPRRGGGGKPGKYLFTGLLACDLCGASFVLRNREYYACASHWHGGACDNTINVSRAVVQEVMLGGIREDLSDPAVLDEVERRFGVAMRRERKPADNLLRIAQLEREIENITNAIARGLLSDALAQRLRAAEADLRAMRHAAQRTAPALLVPNVRARFLEMAKALDQILMRDPERGREELRGILGDKIRMQPDPSGRFLWADYSLGLVALLPKQGNADIVVAGAGFEPATFGL